MNYPIIKRPAECSQEELAEFERVLRLAAEGYAKWEDLTVRIPAAEYLLYIPDTNGQFIAITAMKWPMPHYKEKVFKLSHSPLTPDDYALERGWTYVAPELRNQGIASRITSMVTNTVHNRHTIYATAHIDNVSRRIAEKHGFQQTGVPFPSRFYGGKEVLYVQPKDTRWNGSKFA